MHSLASGQLECSTLRIALRNPDCTPHSMWHSGTHSNPLQWFQTLQWLQTMQGLQTMDWSAEWIVDWSVEWSVALQFALQSYLLAGVLFGVRQSTLQKFWSVKKWIPLQILVLDWSVDYTPTRFGPYRVAADMEGNGDF